MHLPMVAKTTAKRRAGGQSTFRIYHGRGINPTAIAELYNSALGPLEKRMAVTAGQIESRLHFDRRSVYVGFLEGITEPVSLINVVKRAEKEVPDTHQELTDNEL